MAKEVKTNAMRMLDRAKVAYTAQTYSAADGQIDGVSVAQKLGQDEKQVYKTLVTKGHSGNFFVFVVPVAETLDLKKAAKAVHEKNVEMLAVAELLKTTGYVRGGCSPVGMKKLFKTVIDASAEGLATMFISGGRIGLQLALAPRDLQKAVGADFAPIVHSEN